MLLSAVNYTESIDVSPGLQVQLIKAILHEHCRPEQNPLQAE